MDAEEFLDRFAAEFWSDGSPTLDADLYDEVGLDSLDAVHLLLWLEVLANVQSPPTTIPELWTVGDAFAHYCTMAGIAA